MRFALLLSGFFAVNTTTAASAGYTCPVKAPDEISLCYNTSQRIHMFLPQMGLFGYLKRTYGNPGIPAAEYFHLTSGDSAGVQMHGSQPWLGFADETSFLVVGDKWVGIHPLVVETRDLTNPELAPVYELIPEENRPDRHGFVTGDSTYYKAKLPSYLPRHVAIFPCDNENTSPISYGICHFSLDELKITQFEPLAALGPFISNMTDTWDGVASPDSRYMALSDYEVTDNEAFMIADLKTGLPVYIERYFFRIRGMLWSADGRTVVLAGSMNDTKDEFVRMIPLDINGVPQPGNIKTVRIPASFQIESAVLLPDSDCLLLPIREGRSEAYHRYVYFSMDSESIVAQSTGLPWNHNISRIKSWGVSGDQLFLNSGYRITKLEIPSACKQQNGRE